MRWARQQKSKSSRKSGSSGSNPPRASKISRLTNIPAELTAKTSRSPSCCPWSCSPRSSPVTRRPSEVMPTPTSSSNRRSCQPKILGPNTPTLGERSAATSICSKAPESGAPSSCSNQTHSIVSVGRESAAKSGRGTSSRPALTLAPKPGLSVRVTTRSWPRLWVRISPEVSVDPASTPTITSGGRVVRAN